LPARRIGAVLRQRMRSTLDEASLMSPAESVAAVIWATRIDHAWRVLTLGSHSGLPVSGSRSAAAFSTRRPSAARSSAATVSLRVPPWKRVSLQNRAVAGKT
jgi:hypothetical protein